jgi:hypothetical protein
MISCDFQNSSYLQFSTFYSQNGAKKPGEVDDEYVKFETCIDDQKGKKESDNQRTKDAAIKN